MCKKNSVGMVEWSQNMFSRGWSMKSTRRIQPFGPWPRRLGDWVLELGWPARVRSAKLPFELKQPGEWGVTCKMGAVHKKVYVTVQEFPKLSRGLKNLVGRSQWCMYIYNENNII